MPALGMYLQTAPLFFWNNPGQEAEVKGYLSCEIVVYAMKKNVAYKITKGGCRNHGRECAFISDGQGRSSDNVTLKLRPERNNRVNQPSQSTPGRRESKSQWPTI